MAKKADKKEENSKTTGRDGFDNSLSNSKFDLLDRQPLAQQIYTLLTDVEPAWSIRVGLLAAWGEGKTTISNWVIKRAIDDGHIPVLYSPWSAKTDSELWHGFYLRLLQAFSAAKLKFNAPKWRRNWKPLLSAASNSEPIQKMSEATEVSKTGLGVVQSIFAMTKDDVKKLVAQLPKGKRFIIVIDDLDRVEAGLIPRLLLSLRDIMDLESFSFLLPFDEEIITHSLSNYSKAEGYGDNFLEKILDYRVYIKPASQENISILFKDEIKRHCPFLDETSFDSVIKFLPKNPRKLKSLVRSLRSYEQQAKRHRPGEIDWRALMFGQMIRAESEKFFQIYAKDTFYRTEEKTEDEATDVDPWTDVLIEEDKEEGNRIELSRISLLLDRAKIASLEKRERLTELCEGMRKSYGYAGQSQIQYSLKLVDKPEILTWGEFDSLWDKWAKKKKIAAVKEWVKTHAEKMQIPSSEVVRELVTTLSQKYGEILERASSVTLSKEQADLIDKAQNILELIDAIFVQKIEGVEANKILEVRNFQSIYNVMLTWIHFTGNDSDKKQRNNEKEYLKRWVKEAEKAGLQASYSEYLSKISARDTPMDKKESLTKNLSSELLESIKDGLLDATLGAFYLSDGIQRLMPYDAGIGVKNILLNPESSIWHPFETSKAVKILKTAKENPIIQNNALRFLDFIRKAVNEGTYEMSPTEVSRIFAAPEVVKAIWDAAIATPLQFRRLSETRDLATYLESKGVDKSYIEKPAWLLVTHAP